MPDFPRTFPLSMMNDKDDDSDIRVLPHAPDLAEQPDERERRELLLMRAGVRLVGVFADEVDNVSAGSKPTPLPHAPATVLGVVCVRGRMRTLLDPSVMLGDGLAAGRAGVAPPFIVALRGDEQLALAVERVERIIEIFDDALEPLAHAADFVRGAVQHAGTPVVVLAPEHLFKSAIESAERRRPRVQEFDNGR